MFETLHTVSSRAIAWLLRFFGVLLMFLGHYSTEVANIARAFPSTLHRRSQYLCDKVSPPSVTQYVVCPTCLSLYIYDRCLQRRGAQMSIKSCTECGVARKHIPLLREIVTSKGSKKYYPYLVYPYVSLISSLQSLFLRPNFYNNCELWRKSYATDNESLSDVYEGLIWREFQQFDGKDFLNAKYSLGFILNIDWFQPFKHRVYSIGVIYLAVMNLPRSIRFKRENIIIISLLPGPSEPSKTINTYITPLVSELLTLWDGVSFRTHDYGNRIIRCALLCVGCDLPAGRKTCGFLSYTANLGCSRCYCNFGTGQFGKQNYSGFDRTSWILRKNLKHREDVKCTLVHSSKTERQRKESQLGCRYSCFLQLPYFDAVRMLIIDPMHNLYLGTAKYIFNVIWLKGGVISRIGLREINHRIQSWSVSPKIRFARLPSDMEHSSSLTAEQWMIWVNYYSLNCLYGVIPQEHLECWRHFVLASRLLCKRQLSRTEVRVADALLLKFCSRFEVIYGSDAVTPNIHLHAHLTDCVNDFGPMSSFWLFSFERFNGILGDEPTNNRSIEIQLITRFLKDNSHLHLLSSIPSSANAASNMLSHVVLGYMHNIISTKHLDSTSCQQITSEFLPANKYTISSFSEFEMDSFSAMYREVFPNVFEQNSSLYFPQSFKKMLSVTINGQQMKCNNYISARCVFPFSNNLPNSPLANLRTVFTDPDTRPAKIHFFFVHSIQISSSQSISHPFAYVSWPMRHPLHSLIGKPFEIWCLSLFENCTLNSVIPLNNIVSLLMSAEQIFEDENVLVTVPVIF